MHLRIMLILMALITGCASNNKFARINDVSVPIGLDTGYRVIAVDGNAENRVSSDIVSVVPYVLLKPGTHKLTLQTRDKKNQTTVICTVAADKSYRIADSGKGVITLVEDLR